MGQHHTSTPPASTRSRASTPPTPIRSPLTFDDLAADLLWPKLLRAPILALSPARLGIAFFLLIVVVLIVSLFSRFEAALGWRGSEDAIRSFTFARNEVTGWITAPSFAASGSLFVDGVLALPGAAIQAHPLAASVALLLVIICWCIGGGAISRSVACDVAGTRPPSWPETLGFAAGRWRSLAGAVLLPLVLVGVIALLLAIAGLVLRVPGLNVLGSIAFGLMLLGGIVAVLLLVIYSLGHWMLIPAVASDGSDAIDSVQRSYAYVLGRPVRLIIYLLILAVQGFVVVGLAAALSSAAMTFTSSAAATWAGPDARTMLAQAEAGARGGDEAEKAVLQRAARQQYLDKPLMPPPADGQFLLDRSITFAWGSQIIQLWLLLPALLAAALAVSYIHCGSTLLYLLMRRLNDGQDEGEIWQPRSEPAALADVPDEELDVPAAAGDAD